MHHPLPAPRFLLNALQPFYIMDTKLLELLVCPVTKGPLIWRPEQQELLSLSAGLAYPVRDGIPIMLEAEARPLNEAEIDAARSQHPTTP